MVYRFVPAADLPLTAVVDALNLVYPSDLESVEGFGAYAAANNVDMARSVLALDDAGEIAAIAMLGVRGARGWCGDAAVVPAHQKRGLGQALMRELSARARTYGLEAIQLEVREDNAAARRVYEKEGYARSRRLHNYLALPDELGWHGIHTPAEMTIRRDRTEDALRRWHGTRFAAPPCWERELPSLLAYRHSAVWVAENSGREVACLAVAWREARRRLDLHLLALANDATHADVRALYAHAAAETGIGVLRMGLEPPDSRAAVMLREFGFRLEKEFWEMRKVL